MALISYGLYVDTWLSNVWSIVKETGSALIMSYRSAFLKQMLQYQSNTYFILWVFLCSISFPADNAHAQYIVTCGQSGSTIFFHIISQTARFSKKKNGTQNVYFDFLYNFFLKLFHSNNKLDELWSKLCISLHVMYPLFLSDYNETWIFPTHLPKNTHVSNFMKILPVESSCSMRINGRTDRRDKANSRF
jgi:hypothetical protein